MLKRGLTLAFFLSITFALSAPWVTSQAATSHPEGAVPAYNAGPPPQGTNLPPILAKDQLWAENAQYPSQTHAYELAAKIPLILHQQPCYCYCERMGHTSLHSCFESTHGAECTTCLKEAYYSYREHRKGKAARQIRRGIIKGEWKQVDLQTAASIN